MGRHAGRSRGCRTCIIRRVKCGEETPQCHQCISSGWDCPGPVEGAIFIDMSERVRQKTTRSVAERSRRANRPQDPSHLHELESDFGKHEAVVAAASTLPTTYQPNRGHIFQDLYIAHFISVQDTTVHSWLAELPKLACAPSSRSELYGIRAATMALYGRLCHNRDLELEASKWYSKGLDAQRETLPLATRKQSYAPFNDGAVGAAVMFACFETVICTVPMGWMQHYEAAVKMLEIVGPEKCQSGLMYMFFRSIRVAAFITSLTKDQPSILASELWCTVPFDRKPKTPFDKLVDLLLQLPSCLPCRNEMRSIRDESPAKSEVLRRCLGTTAKYLLSRLDDFWLKHKEEVDPDYDQRIQGISSYLANDKGDRQEILRTHPFKSSPDAYVTSMFDAGKLIALGLLGAASLVPNSYAPAIIVHGASILAAAAYCETQGLFNGVSFTMVFPIKLVCLLSPSVEQRTLAQHALLRWGSERGLDDICKMSAPSYLDRSHG